jgi:hypothetical protein
MFCNGGLEFKHSGKIWFSKMEIKDHLHYIKKILPIEQVNLYIQQIEIVKFEVQPVSILQLSELECQIEIEQKIE